MGILEKMRTGQDSTFMQVVMAVIILSFIGFMGRSGGTKGSNVAVVNGTPITDIAFSRAYRSESRAREAQAQRSLSDAEQKQLVELVKSGLVEQEVLVQEARRLGLEVSDSEVARVLYQSVAFKGEDGKFSEEQYQRRIKQEGTTQDEFEQRIRDQLLREKLRQLVFLGASSSEAALKDAWVSAGTKLDLMVVRVRPQAFASDLVLTDADRAEWLKENEASVQEAYDRDKARLYEHPDQVRLRMIKLALTPGGPTAAELAPRLEALRTRIAGGEDMGELAKRWSEDATALHGGDLGLRPASTLPAEVGAAITGLDAKGVSAVVTTSTDVRIVRVEERVAAKVDTFDEVKVDITDRLIQQERLPGLALKFAEEELLPKWKEGGAPPEELLASKGLAARPTGPFTFDDPGPLAPPQAALDAARTAEPGTVLPQVYEEGGTIFVLQLTSREQPDPAEYEARKSEIREQLLLDRRSDFYEAWVADLKSRARIEMVGAAAQ